MQTPTTTKPLRLKSITVLQRKRLLAQIARRGGARWNLRSPLLSMLGDGGVSVHENGEVQGVCAEAPLPRVTIVDREFSLHGAGGVAVMVRRWGIRAQVSCPLGAGRISALQRKLLKKYDVACSDFRSQVSQVTRHIQRVFAEGHQLTHLETIEPIRPVAGAVERRCVAQFARFFRGSGLLCIVDAGGCGLHPRLLQRLLCLARGAEIRVLYEPRMLKMPDWAKFDFIKVNQNQMSLWFGPNLDSDEMALTAAAEVLRKSGAKAIFYTRGDRGLLVCHRVGRKFQKFLVMPESKQLFDSIAAGDVVTAALVYGILRGFSAKEAACFAATAAEYNLDRRQSKVLDVKSLLHDV